MKKNLTPKYILSFLLRFFAVILTGFGIFGVLLLLLLNKKIGPAYAQGISTLTWLQTYLPVIIFTTAFFQALAICVIAGLIALLWSHSIAGPLLRFRRNLRNIEEGRFLKEPIVFRDNDQLHGLAQAFSGMVIAHKEKSAKSLVLLVEAQKIIDECKVIKNQRKDSGQYERKLSELKKIYRSIKEIYSL